MKKLLTILFATLIASTALAQAEKSIIIDQNSFRPVQTDALTGVNIDPIGLDDSKRPCARLKVKINRMTREEINAIEVKIVTNNQLTKNKTAEYDNGLIIEMTAKPQTRFYFHHDEFGDSNEVCLDLEAGKEYYLEAYLNQSFSIVINSNVAGADVYLDNIYKGQTSSALNLTVQEVIVGEHTLRIEWGNKRYEQSITVNKGSIFFRQNVDTEASKPQFVVFVVEPQNAVVTIENNHYPLQDGAMQTVLNNGSYNYTVSAVGYHPQSGVFTVSGAKIEKIINLTADSAKVTLTAPNNAEIWVNGAKKGNGEWQGTLVSGTYIFEARKEGHRTATLSTQITSNPAQQNYALPAPDPIVGTVVVTSTPIMADVQLDGKPVGRTPLELNNILVGEHTLTLSKEGYAAKTQKLSLIENKTESVDITLAKTSSASQPQTVKRGSITSAPYKVGDYYNDGKKEGVVFEVSADGRSGKIVSMTESDDYWRVKAKADGWYLPDMHELRKIHKQKKKINITLVKNSAKELKFPYLSSSTGSYPGLGHNAPIVVLNSMFEAYVRSGSGYTKRAVAKF